MSNYCLREEPQSDPLEQTKMWNYGACYLYRLYEHQILSIMRDEWKIQHSVDFASWMKVIISLVIIVIVWVFVELAIGFG